MNYRNFFKKAILCSTVLCLAIYIFFKLNLIPKIPLITTTSTTPLRQFIHASNIGYDFTYRNFSASAKAEHYLMFNNREDYKISSTDQKVLQSSHISSLVRKNILLERMVNDPLLWSADFQSDPLVVSEYVLKHNSFIGSIKKIPAVAGLFKASLI